MKQKKWTGVALAGLLVSVGIWSCSGKQATETLEARAKAIHNHALTVDTHSDTPMRLVDEDWDIGMRHEPGEKGSGKIDLPRMVEGGLDAEFFAAYVHQDELSPEGYAPARERADKLIDAVHNMCASYPDLVQIALSPEDAYRLETEGKRAAFIGLENGYPIGKDISYVQKYYDNGVRYITLCHSGDNDICDSSTDEDHPEDNGLSEFGKQVVAECNRLGIMVDVSHVSDMTFFDVLKITKTPVIASHSSARALCDHPRNLSDAMLKALAENDGVVQVCFVSSFLKKQKPNPEREAALKELREKYGSWRSVKDMKTREKIQQEYMAIYEKYPGEQATLDELVNHIDHIVRLIGADHVGIGTDFDGGGEVKGCEEVSQLPRITEELLRKGYSEEDIRKIWGGNLMRVFKKAVDTSVQLQGADTDTD